MLEQVHARYLIKNIIIDRCRRGVFDAGILQNGSNMAWVECHPDAIADLIGQVNNVGRYNLSFLIIRSTKQLDEHDKKNMRLLVDGRRFNVDLEEHAKLKEPVIQETAKQALKKARVIEDESIGRFQYESKEMKISLRLKGEPRFETTLCDPSELMKSMTEKEEALARVGQPIILHEYNDENTETKQLDIDLNRLELDLTETEVVCDGKSVYLYAESNEGTWTFKDESMTKKFYRSLVHFDQLTKMTMIGVRSRREEQM